MTFSLESFYDNEGVFDPVVSRYSVAAESSFKDHVYQLLSFYRWVICPSYEEKMKHLHDEKMLRALASTSVHKIDVYLLCSRLRKLSSASRAAPVSVSYAYETSSDSVSISSGQKALLLSKVRSALDSCANVSSKNQAYLVKNSSQS